ncbi:MAG: FG-GAP-like repeat-containing protein [Planctomycetota bacterium]|nr:FG-GAP-like repeat-containing protein [Planctomycetota bacterium]
MLVAALALALPLVDPTALGTGSLASGPTPGLTGSPAQSAWFAGAAGFEARDADRGWDLSVDEAGLHVRPNAGAPSSEAGAWTFTIGTSSFGREAAAAPVEPRAPTASGARVDIDRGGLTEWFERRADGIEHGWTIASAPEGDASKPLWIGLRIQGDLSMHIVDDGSGAFLRDAQGALRLRYTYLHVLDANGARVPAKLAASPWGIGIRIEARDAVFPIEVDPVVVPAAWGFYGNQANLGDANAQVVTDRFLTRAAGDVNGDGFGDILCSASQFDGPNGADAGVVYVFRGSATGPVSGTQWQIDGIVPGARMGTGASSAGDLNGDGYADIAVLAAGEGSGTLRVYYNGPSGVPPGPQFTYTMAGCWAVDPAGDVDGDGYDDIVVGAPGFSVGPLTSAGTVWVFFGGPNGIITGPTNPWIRNGDEANAQLGWDVGTAGDVNADGYADIIAGEYNRNGGAGRAIAFYGGPGFRTHSQTPDWVHDEFAPNLPILFGYSTKTAGDLNGDGFSDVVVSAVHGNAGTDGEGVVYVYYGGPGGLQASYGGRIRSAAHWAFFGCQASTIGDADGDGYSDIATSFYAGCCQDGHVYATYGRPAPLGDIILGQQLVVVIPNTLTGEYLGGAGDVNGDGFGDLLVASPLATNTQTREGYWQCFFGSPNPQSGLTNPLLEPGALQLGSSQSKTGRAVSSAGDLNADGYNDIVVGSPDFGPQDRGRVQVFLGGANGPNFGTPAWTFDSTNNGEHFGWSVSAGDIDNDGRTDIVVGAPDFSNGQANEGRVYLFRSNGGILPATPTWTLESNQIGALLGSSISALGDVNADGFADIAVGAPGGSGGQGTVTIIHGRATGLGLLAPAISLTSGVPGSEFGASLALVGDLNLDGFGDLVVGAPKIDSPQVDEGRIYVYLGSYQGISATVAAMEESQQAGALLGQSLGQCGDINGDGRAEILAGAPGYDAASSGGAAFLYQTFPAGGGITLSTLAVRAGQQPNSQFGYSVSAGGDVNGDGWNDVLAGAPDYECPGCFTNSGRIYLYLGSSSGLATSPSETYDGATVGMRLGESIALGGDVNGDGLSDPLGGVPSANNDDGGVIPLTGGGVTSWRVNSQQRQVGDLQALQILGRADETNQFQMNLGVQNSSGNTATAMGRVPVKLEWEVQPYGTTLSGSAIQSQVSFVDSGALGLGLRLSRNITGLPTSMAFHWRARTVVRSPYYPHTRWTTIQLDGLQEKKLGLAPDCNNNGIGDTIDVALATSLDCDLDTIPDECQVPPLGNQYADCNANLVPDICEYDPLFDCDLDGNLDECQVPPFGNQDCNSNTVPDTCDINSGFSQDSNGDGRPDECQLTLMAAATFCYGDGTGAACPCGNSSPVGNQEGCLNSLGTGGRLRTTGIARVQAPYDNFTLLGTAMPNSSALYFQGTAQQSSGNGAIFGDGKRCAAGAVLRLATKINTGGGSQYPAVGDLPISIKGALPAGGGTRYYQVWYRNAAAFCTISTFNLSNGLRVTWLP